MLTDALIGMVAERRHGILFSIDEFNVALEQVTELLEVLNGGNQGHDQSTLPQVAELNNIFLNNVKIASQPGLNLDKIQTSFYSNGTISLIFWHNAN